MSSRRNNETLATRLVAGIESDPTYSKQLSSSSLYADNGAIYSWGPHHMIAMKQGGEWLLNDYRYSASTGRHTLLVLTAIVKAGYKPIVGPMATVSRGNRMRKDQAAELMLQGIAKEYDKIEDELKNHTRKSNTAKKEMLKGQLKRLLHTSKRLTAVMVHEHRSDSYER